MASPRAPKENRAKEKPRLDVSTPAPALKHSPFAALVKPDPATAAAAAAPVRPAVPVALPTPPAGLPAGPVVTTAPAAPAAPAAPTAAAPPPAVKPRGRLILRRETKHRGGKAVVIVSGFAQLSGISDRALADLLQELKQRLGCGGTVNARELLLQGDRPAQVAALLRERGFRVDGVTE